MEDIPDEILSAHSSISSLRPESVRGNSFRGLWFDQIDSDPAVSSLRPRTVRGNSFRNFDASWRADSNRSLRDEVIIENIPHHSCGVEVSTGDLAAEEQAKQSEKRREAPTRSLSTDSTYTGYTFFNSESSSRPSKWRF